jgi:hypothetical protein
MGMSMRVWGGSYGVVGNVGCCCWLLALALALLPIEIESPFKIKLRAVQSSPSPLPALAPPAAKRRGGPGGGLGTPGLAPGPRPPRPHLRKKSVPRREADFALKSTVYKP